MIRAIRLIVVLCLVMIHPYLPGRFDASAATLSLVVRVAGYVSLLSIPLGLAWMIHPERSRLWRRLALGLAGVLVIVVIGTAISANQLAVGVLLGRGGIHVLRSIHRPIRDASEYVGRERTPIDLVCVPAILVAFQTVVLPHAANWSRDRAIRHWATLIVAIESSHHRRGHYPVSLHTLNRDVPTGVVGIERFHYDPNGEAYNLFFVRQHIELDATEVVLFNPRDEHSFTSHELDLLEYDGEQLELRRGDRRRVRLADPHWTSILFD